MKHLSVNEFRAAVFNELDTIETTAAVLKHLNECMICLKQVEEERALNPIFKTKNSHCLGSITYGDVDVSDKDFSPEAIPKKV